MAAVDNTAASAYLKQRFHKRRIENLSYEGSPAFAMIPKKEDFGGENLKVPVSYADLKGRSSSFAVAQANKQGSDTCAFLVTTVSDYALFSIKGQTIKQSKGNMNAWLPALEKEAESAARALARSASWAVFRDSGGDVASIGSNSGAVITLSNRADIQHFEVGMTLEFGTKSGSTITKRSGKLKITAISRDAGTITCNANVTTVTSIADGDLIVPEGDANNRPTGYAGWIADTDANVPTSLFGVNCQIDTVRLGGLRFDASGMNILEAINDSAARLAENGGKPDCLFINFDKFRELNNYLGSTVERVQTKVADVGFRGVMVQGPNSVIEVYADRHCQPNTGWMLQKDTWTLHSSGGVPMLLEEDGQSILREATDDAYEGRWGAYYQIYCHAPGYNCRINNL